VRADRERAGYAEKIKLKKIELKMKEIESKSVKPRRLEPERLEIEILEPERPEPEGLESAGAERERLRMAERAEAKGPAKGLFITIEGIDGCGKSTQAERLCEWLNETARTPGQIEAFRTFEPGGWNGGESLRRLLLGNSPVTPKTELLFFLADRSWHLDAEIVPALLAGRWVVCERYTDSTLAYQSWGRGIALHEVEGLLRWCRFRVPDLTILLDIDVAVARKRLEQRGRRLDRIESEFDEEGFITRVTQGYRELAERYPERIVVLDAALDAENVFEGVRKSVLRRLGHWFAPGPGLGTKDSA
jgi:dTMP kinase